MGKPFGIIVFGPNGSGKTTLGRELARILNFKHMDHEDYYFRKSEIPYTDARSREDCLNLMITDIEKYGSFVLSACTGDFGEVIPRFYKLAVWISAPMELRIKRVEQRAFYQYGDRVREGGDMYEQQVKFNEYVVLRPLDRIEQWAETLACPVIRIDGTEVWRANAQKIVKRFHAMAAERGW